jgi:hypothetical protein
MVASLQSPADIVNDALRRVGYKDRVGSLYEGSKASKAALDIYAQTRDELLRTGEWPFARRDVDGTVTRQAPPGGYVPPTVWDPTIYPPLPWLFEYLYPSDCITVRAVRPQQILVPNFAPRPHLFAIANDGNQRVILSNVASAVITYTGQVTDPTDMDVGFVEALCAAMARRLAIVLTQSADAVKIEAQDEQFETAVAGRQQG